MKRQSAANRILLALAGLVLLAGGILILAGGLDLYRRWHLTPPAGWPLTNPRSVLLSAGDRTRWTDEGWWWPVVIAVLAVIVLLALWGLLAQLRRTHPGRMPIGGTPPTEGVELRDHALSDVIAADARQLPGVHQVRVQMTGRAHHPQCRITLTLTPDSEPGPILQALCHGPLERARQSTGWAQLPTQARLQVTPHKPHRAE
ncbi:alkaline shock response membrane anchor protein AmaP [Streptomyces sp. ISL-98]|uniref:alkaline shock response membrane anchor protein AmaP n=1 Tax=Streptomyces sp. ISL-98 TaxID=2819192 RepID=UPI001BEA9AF0|nr:alkaline shock response membrane anchor protein AmaP [Streptomyces sp. ISL-98]MBT2511788.1 alkaline shock response membrane anchor protein AmaP [Streptomyces sp. ISL-98]